jgi:hypothetical protein
MDLRGGGFVSSSTEDAGVSCCLERIDVEWEYSGAICMLVLVSHIDERGR